MSDPNLFVQWIRERRKSLRLTQADLAERARLSFSAVQKLEAGQRRPSQQVAELLAEALQIAPKERARFLVMAKGGPEAERGGAGGERSGGIRPTNLPAHLTPLIGRDDALEKITYSLKREEVRLLTLTGSPGIGKTRLALQAASMLLPYPDFSDGVFLVTLAPVRDPSIVVRTIAETLGLRDTGNEPIALTLREHLREQKVLLVLDNFEQVVAAAPTVVELMWGCPYVKIVVTSREALHVRGEWQFPVSPLEIAASKQLFTGRAQEVQSGFTLAGENEAAVAGICARMEGVPLAIELVAARVKLLPPKTLLSRLGRDMWNAWETGEREGLYKGEKPVLPLLVGGARDVPERHRTLRLAIGWSYDLLSSDERLLFARLGVFVGGFTLSSVEAVCNAGQDLSTPTLDGLESLLDKSLLKLGDEADREEEAESRYIMLETIREYALERLWTSGEEVATRRFHAEYFLGIASSLDLTLIGESEKELCSQLDRNHDNLRAALSWTIEKGRLDLAAQFGISLSRYWELRGYYPEGRDWLLRIMSAQGSSAELDPDDFAKRASLLMFAGRLSLYMSDYGSSRSLLEESLTISRELGLDVVNNRANQNLGLAEWLQGDYVLAQSRFEAWLTSAEESGNKASKANAFWMLGNLASECGDFERAESLLNNALALGVETGDMYATTGSTRDLGTTLCYEGKYEEAIQLLERALSLARSAKFEVGTSWTLSALGLATLGLGEFVRAEGHFRESLALARKMDKHRIRDTLEGLAEVELARATGESNNIHLLRAAVLLGASEAARRILGTKIIPVRAPVRERLISEVRSRLGDEEYERKYALGQAMSLEEAIEYALESVTVS